jgi:prepilin-type N-terminal cleavage/methylation domain-containing protein
MSALRRPTRRRGGFTLLEVLVSLAIVALVVFPMLQVLAEAQKQVYDAKFATLCEGRVRSLIAEKTRTAKPGESGSGDFTSMTTEEGFDERFAYANIRYEWQCQSVDLSTDVTPAADLTDEQKKEQDDKKKKQDEQKDSEAADAAIDARYRARYFHVLCTYNLEDGTERQIVVETYAPPLPTAEELKTDSSGRTYVPPNDGSGSSGGGGGG